MTDLTPLVRLVDDDEIFLMSQKLLLQTCGFETVSYASAEAFLEHDLMTRPGCLIADVRMPGLTGLDLQKVLQTRRFSLPMIFLTGHGDVSMAVHTMRNGASDFLEKPVKPEVLIAAVKKAVAASCEAQRARDELEPFVLRRTLARYNKAVAEKKDADFGKTVFLQTIEKPPFYWGKEVLSVHNTLGGISTDTACRVRKVGGGVIEGLYAAGETAGGIFGRDRLGGMQMTACFVMGRTAGREAAQRALQKL